jgi:hypothetical protein
MQKLKRNLRKLAVKAIMHSSLYRWVLVKVLPYFRFTTYYPKSNGFQYHIIESALIPGSLLFIKDNAKLAGKLIPGDWDHVAICVGKNIFGFVFAEMVVDGFRFSHLFDIMKECDHAAVKLCPDFWNDENYPSDFINRVIAFRHAKYDIGFTLGVKELYCSELVYAADTEKRIKYDLEDLAGIGKPYISPQGLFDAANLVKLIDTREIENERSDKIYKVQ